MPDQFDARTPAAGIDADLAAHGDADRASAMRAYLRDQFDFHGVGQPMRRQIQRDVVNASRSWSSDQLLDFAEECWRYDAREMQYVALDVLCRRAANIDPKLDRVEALIRNRAWWDTVDLLAAHVVGSIVAREPSLVATMDDWVDDDDFWIARTAILHQLRYGAAADRERLFAYVDRHGDAKEFFIRKACGWALRQHARVEPDAVRSFVEERRDRLPGLTQREALKHLR